MHADDGKGRETREDTDTDVRAVDNGWGVRYSVPADTFIRYAGTGA